MMNGNMRKDAGVWCVEVVRFREAQCRKGFRRVWREVRRIVREGRLACTQSTLTCLQRSLGWTRGLRRIRVRFGSCRRCRGGKEGYCCSSCGTWQGILGRRPRRRRRMTFQSNTHWFWSLRCVRRRSSDEAGKWERPAWPGKGRHGCARWWKPCSVRCSCLEIAGRPSIEIYAGGEAGVETEGLCGGPGKLGSGLLCVD